MYNQPGREALQVHSIVALDHKSHDLDQRVHPIISRDIQLVVPLGVNSLLLRNPAEKSSQKQRCVCLSVFMHACMHACVCVYMCACVYVSCLCV